MRVHIRCTTSSYRIMFKTNTRDFLSRENSLVIVFTRTDAQTWYRRTEGLLYYYGQIIIKKNKENYLY